MPNINEMFTKSKLSILVGSETTYYCSLEIAEYSCKCFLREGSNTGWSVVISVLIYQFFDTKDCKEYKRLMF